MIIEEVCFVCGKIWTHEKTYDLDDCLDAKISTWQCSDGELHNLCFSCFQESSLDDDTMTVTLTQFAVVFYDMRIYFKFSFKRSMACVQHTSYSKIECIELCNKLQKLSDPTYTNGKVSSGKLYEVCKFNNDRLQLSGY